MEFRINRETTVRWPNKCVWCSEIPTKKMKTQGGWIWQKRLKVEYPLCSKHYFLIKGTQIIDWVIFMIWVSPLSRMPYELIFPIMLLVIWILSIISRPVKIRVSGDFYTMKIRNDDYAREFAMLNNLSPTL
jgi:hypothetical protein